MITIHFLLSLISDTLLGFFAQTFFLTLICQVSFIIWGLFLSISFMIIFRRLYRSTVRIYRESVRLSISKRSLSLTTQSRVRPTVRMPRNSWGNAIKLSLLIAFLGVLTALLQLYGIIVVYSPVAGVTPEPWPWWAYQFVFRCVELAMCFTMSYVATQPFRYTRDGQEKDPRACCYCCASKKEEEADESAYWAEYFAAASPETFLPKREPPPANGNHLATQTSWNGPGSNVNDASVYDANSLKKLLHKGRRFKPLTKSSSIQNLDSDDLSQRKVTSQSFSSFGIFFNQDSAQVIRNDLAAPQAPAKNYNMNSNHKYAKAHHRSSPALTLLLAAEEDATRTQTDKSTSPMSVTTPLLTRESTF
ncbi:putative proline-rich transmembrane protein 4 isoform X2 [Apostichopus japonicus]|uniref:Putative proline-rich transmembrane protein 4 isoform X2 n=1 Tax=Stichopus japonicus TaxID=307972 RepID=A0A2G8JYX7_STIJA|nr:putative proline-rich transmembrane protein 4 isoform X2 [Apostichopus japonicus]